MVKVDTDVQGRPLNCEIYLDGTEKSNLDALHQFRIHDWDSIGLITGEEGDGKTSFGVQRAYYQDAGLRIDKIVFSPEQFLQTVNECDKMSAIVWDESDAIGEHWASNIISTIKKTFKRIRKKRLFILLVTPTLFDLNKYFTMHRIRFMIHINRVGLQRGFFSFYNKDRLKQLVLKGRKDWNMNAVKPNFIGRFTKVPKGFPIDMSEDGAYESKKDLATQDLASSELTPKLLGAKVRGDLLRKVLAGLEQDYNLSPSKRQLSRWINMDHKTVITDLGRDTEGL